MTKILISLLLVTLYLSAQSRYILTLSKPKVYVGEPLTAILSLEHTDSTKISKMQVSPLKLEGFTVIPVPEKKKDAALHRYILIPQTAGRQTIPSQSIEIAHKDPQTYRNIWQTLQTPPVTLTVLPLPEGIPATGNYTLHSHIDRNSTEANQPVHLTLTIQGKGSLENIPQLQLPLEGALVFDAAPQIRSKIIDGTYQSTYTQHFAIIADKDFTLPSLTWQYLNTDTGLTETLSTLGYAIQVNNPLQKTLLLKYLLLLLVGIFLGALLTLGFFKWHNRKKPPASAIAKAIRKTKTDQALYTLLLPYADNDGITEVLRELEENMHQGARHKINHEKISEQFTE